MTRRDFEGDPIEALRRADPLNPLEVPKDTTGAHARALFQEVTRMDRNETVAAPRKQPLRRRMVLAAGGLAVLAAAAFGGYTLLKDEADPVTGGEPIGSGPMAMCIQWTEQMLLDQDYAFDGTLVSANADGTNAVFEVHRWYKGGEGATVTLSAEGLLLEHSVALLGATLEIGERYLVSGTDGFVWACGFTVTYDTELANHWAEIFGA